MDNSYLFILSQHIFQCVFLSERYYSSIVDTCKLQLNNDGLIIIFVICSEIIDEVKFKVIKSHIGRI